MLWTLSVAFDFRAASLASRNHLTVRRLGGSTEFIFEQPFSIGDVIILRS